MKRASVGLILLVAVAVLATGSAFATSGDGLWRWIVAVFFGGVVVAHAVMLFVQYHRSRKATRR